MIQEAQVLQLANESGVNSNGASAAVDIGKAGPNLMVQAKCTDFTGTSLEVIFQTSVDGVNFIDDTTITTFTAASNAAQHLVRGAKFVRCRWIATALTSADFWVVLSAKP